MQQPREDPQPLMMCCNLLLNFITQDVHIILQPELMRGMQQLQGPSWAMGQPSLLCPYCCYHKEPVMLASVQHPLLLLRWTCSSGSDND